MRAEFRTTASAETRSAQPAVVPASEPGVLASTTTEQEAREKASAIAAELTIAAVPPAPQIDDALLQARIVEVVRARVQQSIGAGGNWTITFRRDADTDTFFSDTMAEMIARDVAKQLAEIATRRPA